MVTLNLQDRKSHLDLGQHLAGGVRDERDGREPDVGLRGARLPAQHQVLHHPQGTGRAQGGEGIMHERSAKC